ncbi:MAG TPA: hypothetical protein ENK57_24945 [Polyangiaceae bacterium]|nr:hypothetical protein [Polyangiaceae bacterium]
MKPILRTGSFGGIASFDGVERRRSASSGRNAIESGDGRQQTTARRVVTRPPTRTRLAIAMATTVPRERSGALGAGGGGGEDVSQGDTGADGA